MRVGADFLLGAKSQQIYSGRVKLGYVRPYSPGLKEGFRNTFDYGVDYGRTDGVLSANRMYASEKVDFDIGGKFFPYKLAPAGYDEIRKIDFEYQVGPGIGYHLFTQTNFLMNVEVVQVTRFSIRPTKQLEISILVWLKISRGTRERR